MRSSLGGAFEVAMSLKKLRAGKKLAPATTVQTGRPFDKPIH